MTYINENQVPYKELLSRPRLYLIDVDGTIFRQKWPRTDSDPSIDLLPGVREKINSWYTDGHTIILMTARPDTREHRLATEQQLFEANVLYHKLMMGLPTGQRILINDVKPEESHLPTAVAINLNRNQGMRHL